ncbi:MAG: hypothetical protein RL696_798, partial [Actinomycetota bacterium]
MDEQNSREELEKLLKQMFESGQLNPEELAKVAGAGMSPQLMGQLFEQVRAMMSDSTGPVNWELATKTA